MDSEKKEQCECFGFRKVFPIKDEKNKKVTAEKSSDRIRKMSDGIISRVSLVDGIISVRC